MEGSPTSTVAEPLLTPWSNCNAKLPLEARKPASLLLLHFVVGELLRHGARRYEGDQIGSEGGGGSQICKEENDI